jgi:pSer/pThr/pTyr-binding forkhead associated (FHA) protein
VINDGGVSRIHAEVRRSADGHRVVDSGSANGTTVNGERVTEHQLVDGDVIRVGDTELHYRL